jgi:hypothetical protein
MAFEVPVLLIIFIRPNPRNVARFLLPPVDFGTGPFEREFTPTHYASTAVIVGGEAPTVKVRPSFPNLPSIRSRAENLTIA